MEHYEVVNAGIIVVSETPASLWDNAMQYFKHCKDNPISAATTVRTGKKAGEKAEVNHLRPFTVKGLCLHCGILEEYLKDVLNTKSKDSEYYIVVRKILDIIYIQNVEMAMVGEYSPIFVSKMLNMDNEENNSGAITVNVVQGLPALAQSENEILEKLELEKKEIENRQS